jgi:IS1 family transposase
MNQLSIDERARILAALVEGNSIRAIARMTGKSRNTIDKLLCDLGRACSEYQDKVFRNLNCRRIQCDEIWSFVGAKEKNCTAEMKAHGSGDAWTWVAIDADTKLVPCWFLGERHAGAGYHFMHDLKARLANRVQLTTDAHRAYLDAVPSNFGDEIDYAQLVKLYGKPRQERNTQARYSPAVCMGAFKTVISGAPEYAHVSTSYIERQNLTMRMSMRRFTRLTNAFSKKLENHEHAIAIHYMYYNFARIHSSLRVTPAMEAGISDHVWSIEEVISLL